MLRIWFYQSKHYMIPLKRVSITSMGNRSTKYSSTSKLVVKMKQKNIMNTHLHHAEKQISGHSINLETVFSEEVCKKTGMTYGGQFVNQWHQLPQSITKRKTLTTTAECISWGCKPVDVHSVLITERKWSVNAALVYVFTNLTVSLKKKIPQIQVLRSIQ